MKFTVRNAFIADKGYTMAEFDYAQAEAMVVAWLAQDETAKNAFKTGQDVHSLMAARLFNKEYNWVVENKKTLKEAKIARQTAKPVVHGFNYGMGPKALYKELLSRELPYKFSDAKAFLRKMAYVSPKITLWHREIQEAVKNREPLVTPLGYRRRFSGRITDKTFREAYAFIPQSTVGQLLNMAWLNVYNELGDEVDILMNVYDSITVQFRSRVKDEELELLKAIKQQMLISLTIKGEELTIPVDCKVGTRYGSLEEIDL
jgi:DNA polymerase I